MTEYRCAFVSKTDKALHYQIAFSATVFTLKKLLVT